MSQYYYFAATLPALSLDEPPAWTFAQFREMCEEHLCAADLHALDALTRDSAPRGAAPFARAWRDRDVLIRNASARARAARVGRDAAPYLREGQGFDSSIEHAVEEAFSRANPVERERALDRRRWAQIDELAGHDLFAAGSLLAYGLKLKLAERWAGLSEDEGLRKTEEIVRAETPGSKDEPETSSDAEST